MIINYTPLSHQKDYDTVKAGKRKQKWRGQSAILGWK